MNCIVSVKFIVLLVLNFYMVLFMIFISVTIYFMTLINVTHILKLVTLLSSITKIISQLKLFFVVFVYKYINDKGYKNKITILCTTL